LALLNIANNVAAIIAALTGTILGWILHTLSQKGKIEIDVYTIHIIPHALRDTGYSSPYGNDWSHVDPIDAEKYVLELNFEFNNTSPYNNAVRDINITLRKKRKALHSYELPKYGMTATGALSIDIKKSMNISGRSVSERLIHHVDLDKSPALQSNRITLDFKDSKGKKYSKILEKYKDINTSTIIKKKNEKND